ncbi:DUF2437 domain-containing protein [Burkholderia multivorans]|uniref:DUF2437 domain-containing protein n=1 Tax=Burkholderia multivorans TaxID=87883 RepID=UPI0021599F4E|nr:DUF2437 domain-containing protein [Burkholderia multivorans]
MRLVSFERNGKTTVGVREGDEVRVLGEETLESLLARGGGMDKVSANSYHKPCSYELRLAYYYFAQ